jgi:trehalose/maltose hydrolase-like predicted phosphorylase
VALKSDVEDIQGGTTKEGILMGVMAGTLDLVQRSYMGAHVRDGVLHFDPRPPAEMASLSFAIQFHRTPLRVELADRRLTLTTNPEGVNRAIKLGFGDQVREFSAGGQCTFELAPEPPAKQHVQS